MKIHSITRADQILNLFHIGRLYCFGNQHSGFTDSSISFLACLILLCLFYRPNLAHANSLPLKNADFQTWDERTTSPSDWQISNKGYRLNQDCRTMRLGKCSLSMTGTGSLGNAISLRQSFPLKEMSLQKLKLTGWIRTENLQDGFAALWLRTIASTGEVTGFNNMARTAPSGTTDWRHFEIQLPIATGSDKVYVGVLMSGSGTAWFDSLTLESVDASLQETSRFDAPALLSGTLQSAEQIAIDDQTMAFIKPEWKHDVRKRAKPIRSLQGDDFSDLQFLKPLLANKRIVQIGESAHGVAQFHEMKTRLIKFLHKEMGFDVIAFESPLSDCKHANDNISTVPSSATMYQCLYSVWHSQEKLDLFSYLKQQKQSGVRIDIAGFDINEHINASQPATKKIGLMLAQIGSLHQADFHAAENTLRRFRQTNLQAPKEGETVGSRAPDRLALAAAQHTDRVYRHVLKEFSRNNVLLKNLYQQNLFEVELAIQTIKSRRHFIAQVREGATSGAGQSIRDKGMASNLTFLLDKAYPGRKVIVLGHNAHLSAQQSSALPAVPMGALMSRHHRQQSYSIGLYMGWGHAGKNDRQTYYIGQAPDNSMEAVLANAGFKLSFVDFANAKREPGTEWFHEPITTRNWGVFHFIAIPARLFDAVIYVDSATPPTYR